MNNQTFTGIVKVMERGLVVIPQKVRESTGIGKGSYLKLILNADEIVLKPVTDSDIASAVPAKKLSIKKSSYSKAEGLKLLSQMKPILWSKKDNDFLATGRKQIEKKLQKVDSL